VVKIRLKRMGTKKRPVYRIVVADSRSPRDGRFIEAIGFYDPLPNPSVIRVDEEKVRIWMGRGARPSDSARELLVRQGILTAPPRPVRPPKPVEEKLAAEPAEAKAESSRTAPEKPGDETTAAEAPVEAAAEEPATAEPDEEPAVTEPVEATESSEAPA
jgi:small subunit ribosomal protein S16